MKSKLIKILSFIIIFVAAAAFSTTKLSFNICSFSSNVTKESGEVIQNPYHGFYHIYAFALTDEDETKAVEFANRIKTNNPYSLALVEINLRNFSNRNLNEAALNQLETILSSTQKSDKKMILRFLYDWDGKASETEPQTIEQIFTHMDQVAEYVNKYKSEIYIMQGIFVGDCGEMHGSQYMSVENMNALINHLHGCIDPSIFLAVRTPQHWRIINNTTAGNLTETLTANSLASRLSLFNDGMLGSDIDLGTYGVESFANSNNPSDKGTRAEEIAFQNELCNLVPNGGECVIDNPYNDFENAINDFSNMHVSYLNCDYDPNVMNKWKATTYISDDAFNGKSGYDYIEAHLGYRYVVNGSTMSEQNTDKKSATVDVSIENTGFSPAYKQFESSLVLINTQTDKRTYIPVEFDNRTLLSNTSRTLNAKIDTSSLESGLYNVYYQMYIPSGSAKQLIILANEGYSITDSGLLIGTLSIEQ